MPYKIYQSNTNEITVEIDGGQVQGYARGSLYAKYNTNNNTVWIYEKQNKDNIVPTGTPVNQIQNQSGATFQSVMALRAYLGGFFFNYATGSGGTSQPANISDVSGLQDALNNKADKYLEIEAKENIARFQIVTSDGFVANTNNVLTGRKIAGIADTATTTGNICKVIREGRVNYPNSFPPGADICLNGSEISTIPPATGYIRQLGCVINSNSIIFSNSFNSIFKS